MAVPTTHTMCGEELDVTANVNDVWRPFSNGSRALTGFNVLVALDEKSQWARISQPLWRREADGPNPFPGGCGKLSYHFQWIDWVMLLSSSF